MLPNRTWSSVIINGLLIEVIDFADSIIPKSVSRELTNNAYNIDNIEFNEGDIVIDIGANIGLVSLYLAKRHPNIKIYAYEPIPDNYINFLENIERNQVKNIFPRNMAITKDGRTLKMIVNFYNNSGGATAHLADMSLPNHFYYMVPSVILDNEFKEHSIKNCKLLKIDCEGTEHEILLSTNTLPLIEYLSGEFHINQNLISQGYSLEGLIKHCGKYIKKDKMKISNIKMAE